MVLDVSVKIYSFSVKNSDMYRQIFIRQQPDLLWLDNVSQQCFTCSSVIKCSSDSGRKATLSASYRDKKAPATVAGAFSGLTALIQGYVVCLFI